jgi:outer membrane protein assembly factor BamE
MGHFLNLRRFIVLFSLLCSACGTALPSIKPFKLEVQQGNVVTSKMLLQLRPGMTKSQVRFIMGTPLIQDSFHGNRWDYAYQLREQGKILEQRRVILDFENELLKRVRGDVVPAGSAAALALKKEADEKVVVVKKVKEKSLMDKLKFWDNANEVTPVVADKATAESINAETVKPNVVKDDADLREQNIPVVASEELLASPSRAEVKEPVPQATVSGVESDAPSIAPQNKTPSNTNINYQSETGYQSEAGMRFDRALTMTPLDEATIAKQFVDDEAPVVAKPTPKTPAPKAPQVEPEAGMFDQILQRIGF